MSKRCIAGVSVLLGFGPLVAEEVPSQLGEFFGRYCVECHGPEEQEADFRIDTLGMADTPEAAEYWQLVLDNLHLGDMPPAEKPQPAIEELEPVTAWIEGELKRARAAMRGEAGEVVLRRLNETEYRNTIEDLFNLRGDFTAGFPDDAEEHGFDNNGAALMLSAAQVDQYLDAASFVLERVIRTGERPETKTARFTLHDLNENKWAGDRKNLERRLEKFENLTPAEQKRTREMEEKFEADPYHSFQFPIWENGTLRAARPEDAGHATAVLAVQTIFGGSHQLKSSTFLPVREPGWYRYSFRAYPVANDGKPVRMEVAFGSFGPGVAPKTAGVLYLTNREPETFTFDLYLQANEQVMLRMLDGAPHGNGQQSLEFEGPFMAIDWMQLEGPLFEQWPPKSHEVIFGGQDPENLDEEAVAGIVAHFGGKLFRRPVEPETVSEYTAFWRQQTENEDPLEALKTMLKAMMVAPQFLYHVDPPDRLDPYALASRLSYFLWRSTPDEELLDLAASGQLANPEILSQQVDRLLMDPRSSRFLTDFVGQWLQVDQVGEMVPDSQLYPEFDEELERAMVEETRGFIAEMLANDLPLSNLIDSDWTILNDRLAEHYGIEGVEGPDFRKVKLDKSQTVRGGLLTHASILNVTSNGTTTSPIIRGVWVLDHLLGTPAPPPPPDVPAIEPDIRGATTIKEQLAKHRDIPQCASCHRKIDPFGIALENFDVIGGWRDHYRALEQVEGKKKPELVDGQPILSDDSIQNLGSYADFTQFRQLLTENNHLITQNMADKLATFALGRTMNFSDRESLEAIARETQTRNGGMRTMIHALVRNELFQQP